MSYSWGAGPDRTGTDGFPVVRIGPSSRPRGTVEHGGGGATLSAIERRRLAAELAPMVDLWQRLLAQHVPDRAGRCRTCTKGGTGLPSVAWPCSIQGIAVMASRHGERG